jgi:hypothetical protein
VSRLSRGMGAFIGVGLAVAICGCGRLPGEREAASNSSNAPSSNAPSSNAPSTMPAGPHGTISHPKVGQGSGPADSSSPSCSASQVSLSAQDLPLSSGDVATAITVQNLGPSPCSLTGYPTISFSSVQSAALGAPITNGIADAALFEPSGFSSTTANTQVGVAVGASATFYVEIPTRGSSSCPVVEARLGVGWSGSNGDAVYPSTSQVPGLFFVEFCPVNGAAVSPIGPTEQPVFLSTNPSSEPT